MTEQSAGELLREALKELERVTLTYPHIQGPLIKRIRAHLSQAPAKKADGLLPCPFCGGVATIIAGLVGCQPCAIGRRNAQSWNTRSQASEPMQLPPLTDLMYHAVRGSEYHFTSGGENAVVGYLDDDCLDDIWDNINTALRVAGVKTSERADGVMVPREPTEAMLDAAADRSHAGHPPLLRIGYEYANMRELWRAMLSATPAASVSADARDGEWIPLSRSKPDTLEVRIKMTDGSELNVWTQSDGDFWWKPKDAFIDESQVTHWKPNLDAMKDNSK